MPESQYKFGEFELDCAMFELRRRGRRQKIERVRLERIPTELLILLAEQQGKVVSRREIVERLWGKDVFVDTDHGINTAIRKIRQALRDDPDRPRYIQTVPGKGYRFLISTNDSQSPPLAPALESLSIQNQPLQTPKKTIVRAAPARFDRIKLTFGAITVSLATILLVLGVPFLRHRFFSQSRPQIHSLAVLPLVNLSGDESENYFADGMTDEVITMLAKNTSLQVISRTSTVKYRNPNQTTRDIARELGVDGLLEGSIERSADHVHMTVQLIYAPTDSHIWAESYDRPATNAMALPVEISEAIAKKTNNSLTPPAKPFHVVNPDAYDLFLKGQYLWFAHNTDKAEELFREAIRIQPDFAAPWAGLAECYGARLMSGVVPFKEVQKELEADTRKAVELDDSSPEAHNVMTGWYLLFKWDFEAADTESRRSVTLNPSFAEGYHMRAYVLLALNRREEAIKAQQRATELDPFGRPGAWGYVNILSHRFDAAIADLRLREQAEPKDSAVLRELSEAYAFTAKWSDSTRTLAEAFRIEHEPALATQIEQVYRSGGYPAVSKWKADLDKEKARKHYLSPYWLAYDTAHLNLREATLRYLEDAFDQHCPRLIFLQNEPVFDFLHSEPRYQALVKRVGLPTLR
jgi:TolB-like protein/DNA-binding winged helix-turn-helix (wHTH) protein